MSNNSSPVRFVTHPAIIVVFFLVAVNLGCGWLAVEFGYPSLWGKSDVFDEYAYPLPMSWAMTHWPSMLIVAAMLYQMPKSDKAQITKTRRGLMIGIALCIAVEFVFGEGEFHQIPFVLFILVDLSLAYVLSLLLHQPRRPFIAALFTLVVALIIAAPTLRFEYQKYLYDQKREAAMEREAERTRRIEQEEKEKEERRKGK